MTIKEFIEAAIEGGWQYKDKHTALIQRGSDELFYLSLNYGNMIYLINESEIVLDQKAWEAVGKTKGWFKVQALGPLGRTRVTASDDGVFQPMYLIKMYGMVEFLDMGHRGQTDEFYIHYKKKLEEQGQQFPGGTLEEYIATL